jgi:hypothetical protein
MFNAKIFSRVSLRGCISDIAEGISVTGPALLAVLNLRRTCTIYEYIVRLITLSAMEVIDADQNQS